MDTYNNKEILKKIKLSLFIFLFSLIIGICLGKYIPFTLKSNHFRIFPLFKHNFIQGVKLIFLGNLTFGITNSLILAINAFIIGLSTCSIYLTYGFKPILTGVFPHAFLEIAGLILMNTLGYFSIFYLRFIKSTDHKEVFDKKQAAKIGGSCFTLGTILLFIAAIIETRISHS